MKRFKMLAAVLAAALGIAGAANARIEITEWMYSGNGPEFVEFTNVGSTPIDMTGWSFDDDSRIPGSWSLSGFGVVAPGESVLLIEGSAATFRTQWNLPSRVKIVDGNTHNLGRNDEINIYDAFNNLVDRLTYGDQNYPGTVRTQYRSCNIPPSGYGFTVVQTSWVLASVGDVYGSWRSSAGDIGSPGIIPEPGALVALSMGLVGLAGSIRRKR